jgi:hypothetical protein
MSERGEKILGEMVDRFGAEIKAESITQGEAIAILGVVLASIISLIPSARARDDILAELAVDLPSHVEQCVRCLMTRSPSFVAATIKAAGRSDEPEAAP